MAALSFGWGLTQTDSVMYTATSKSTAEVTVANRIGEKAYVFVTGPNQTLPSSFVLFTNGTVFPTIYRALEQTDIATFTLEPGFTLHGIVEKGLAIATVVVTSIG